MNDEATLNTVKNRIRALKGQMTKLLKYVNDIDINEKSSISIFDLKARKSKADEWLRNFSEETTQLENLLGTYEEQSREEFTENYFKFDSQVNKLLSILETSPQNSQISQDNHVSEVNSAGSICSVTSGAIRLPELKLIEFNGNYDQWSKFKETFKALIHDNFSLTEIQKFYYLNSCLRGSATQVLNALEITAANYTKAWNLLEDRYENKRLIINTHLKAIFELESINKENHFALRKLLDEFLKHKTALQSQGQPVESWDTLFIYLLSSKLDCITRKTWEGSHAGKNYLPTMEDMIAFLSEKCRILETIGGQLSEKDKPKYILKSNVGYTEFPTKGCAICDGNHFISKCPQYEKLPINKRSEKVKSLRLCYNCLKSNHQAKVCRAQKCYKCNKLHHLSLHESETVNIKTTTHCISLKKQVFLSTALVNVRNNKGNIVTLRALLDVGSDSNFICKGIYKKLGLNNSSSIDIQVSGIGNISRSMNKITNLQIESKYKNYSLKTEFLIIEKITGIIPNTKIDISNLEIPDTIELADPSYYLPGDIDVLLGAEVFYDLLLVGRIYLGKGKPMLQKSHLGWIVTGKMEGDYISKRKQCNIVTSIEMHDIMKKFWEIEEISTENSNEIPTICENMFVKTTTRTEDGKFVVCLPLKEDISLGDSFGIAKRRFFNLERRLNQDQRLRTDYQQFLEEYYSNGHMELVEDARTNNIKNYYLPHHAVFKGNSSTTKTRVVFDASAKTTNGNSLNDMLRVGPSIQSSLFDILIRFRKHNVVLTGDIEKMYRQIWVHPRYRDYQRILWRKCQNEELKTFRLKTITYGTGPASFLATRCLKQLSIEKERNFPKESLIIQRDFYMDDLITGGETEEEVLNIRRNITSILMEGGFPLRKFASNKMDILLDCNDNVEQHAIKDSTEEKTLGILWNAREDIFSFPVKKIINQEKFTKRNILRNIAKVFDPLGLLAPVVIKGKMLLQALWCSKVDWDEEIPTSIKRQWESFTNDLKEISNIKIPRQVTMKELSKIEFIGLCDASEKAYGGVIYLRSINKQGRIQVALLTAKSKVAPLKKISLPRLELCGALLLAQLMKRIKVVLNMENCCTSYFTDSGIVLCWINADSARWKTFVSNRVTKIQEISKVNEWHHVKGIANIADLISRGANIKVMEEKRWWTGPEWLHSNTWNALLVNSDYPKFNTGAALELKKDKNVMNAITKRQEYFEKYSSFWKLVRVTAYCLRFIQYCKNSNQQKGCLSSVELNEAIEVLVKMDQREEFENELKQLKTKESVDYNSKILKLSPFLDKKGIIRVGGRLENANIRYSQKHPMILRKTSRLTELIIEAEHKRLLHAGPQAVLASIRNHFWIVRGREVVRNVIRKCVTCFKARPMSLNPLMGHLPAERLQFIRPFHIVSVDYAGPYFIKNSFKRNRLLLKAYLCVFICQSTKAIHLELVTDLTSNAFLGVLKRFAARRGIPTKLLSDNGSNFVGARNEIKAIKKTLALLKNDSNFDEYLSMSNIDWSFIPPKSPHMGGLHEAAVKAAKYHIKRIFTNANLDYETFYTIICQIEGILNSRPICPLSDDPSDLNVLTPGHAIIGQPLMTLPDKRDIQKTTTLKVYEERKRLVACFWKRWSKEYLYLLQTRSKWNKNIKNLEIGQLVLIKEDNLPPQRWMIGRIEECHPGNDGVVRVVTLKTKGGSMKRAVHCLCPFPD